MDERILKKNPWVSENKFPYDYPVFVYIYRSVVVDHSNCTDNILVPT